jgi:hypothetical protein
MERESAIVRKGQSKKEGPRTYIVFGVMRGGTSMVGGVLRGMGLYLGPDISAENHESSAFAHKPIHKIRETIETVNKTHDVWGWKFPHAADYLDRVWGQITNPHLICVYRDPISNARGLNRWHPIGEIQAVHESLLRQQKNLAMTLMRNCPSLLVSYEKAARNPMHFVEELSAWTGLPADHDRFDFPGFMAAQSYKKLEDFQRSPNS